MTEIEENQKRRKAACFGGPDSAFKQPLGLAAQSVCVTLLFVGGSVGGGVFGCIACLPFFCACSTLVFCLAVWTCSLDRSQSKRLPPPPLMLECDLVVVKVPVSRNCSNTRFLSSLFAADVSGARREAQLNFFWSLQSASRFGCQLRVLAI